MRVSGRLRQLRVAAGMSQQTLARLAGVTQTAVSLAERGTAGPDALVKIGSALGLQTLEQLEQLLEPPTANEHGVPSPPSLVTRIQLMRAAQEQK